MNALQRLQETQETLQGAAARLRIDIAGLTVPELAGVIATEAIKLHDELVNVRTALADMERQRDYLATEGAAMAEALGKVKALVESQGVYVGDYWSDIPLAVDTMIAEGPTKPRERVEGDSDSSRLTPTAAALVDLAMALGWKTLQVQGRQEYVCQPSDGADHFRALPDYDNSSWAASVLRMMSGWVTKELAALRARAEKSERELERFQRADVGERVREIEAEHRAENVAGTDGRWFAAATRGHRDRAELLSIVRRQAAEIERVNASLWALSRGAAKVPCSGPCAADKLCAACYGQNNLTAWVERYRDAERQLKALGSRLSAIRERVEKLSSVVLPSDLGDSNPTQYLVRSEVLSALGVVKDSLTTEPPHSCRECDQEDDGEVSNG